MIFKRAVVIITSLIISGAIFLGSGCIKAVEEDVTIYKGTKIDGVDVSGMTAEEAESVLLASNEAQSKEQKYIIEADGKKVTLSSEELGITYDPKTAIEAAIQEAVAANKEDRVQEFYSERKIDEACAKAAIHEAAKELRREAKEPTAEYKGGAFIFKEGEDGFTVDEEEVLKEIKEAISGSSGASEKSVHIKAVAKRAEGDESADKMEEFKRGYEVIGEYTTYFNKDPYNAKNRVNNIVKAAALIDGKEVDPGAEFDTNDVLGDRNKENGWSEAPGIRDGKYEMEYGGGVCQVSTTLYNAALYACLEIVERSPHSWPIGYVPIGRDATISTGGPNLIIKNNTGSKITVSALIDAPEQSITVKIYGRKAEGTGYARVEIESRETGVIPAPKAEVIVDKSLAPGKKVQDRKARDGKTAVTERIYYDETGAEVRREQVAKSVYRAIGARVLKGA